MNSFFLLLGAAMLASLFVTVNAQNQCVSRGGSCLDTRTFNCAGYLDTSIRCPGPDPVLCCFANVRSSQCSMNGGYCTNPRFGCNDGRFDYYQNCPRRGLVCCATSGGGAPPPQGGDNRDNDNGDQGWRNGNDNDGGDWRNGN